MERYTLSCSHCHGEGCSACRGGEIPVYVIETGGVPIRCSWRGHKYIGDPNHVANEQQLPRVCWCQRCSWRRIQTDVPEAYPVRA